MCGMMKSRQASGHVVVIVSREGLVSVRDDEVSPSRHLLDDEVPDRLVNMLWL